MAMFTTLKDEDLISIGITSFGARKIMLNAIQGKICIYSFKINQLIYRTKIGLANLEECLLLNEDVTNDFISTQHGCPGKKKI
jgi:hypothetical protein